MLLRLNLSSSDWNQELELGVDQSATDSFESMDRPIPPSGPVKSEHQAYLVGDPTVGSQQIPKGQELVIIDSQVER